MNANEWLQKVRPRFEAEHFRIWENGTPSLAKPQLVARQSRFDLTKFGFFETFFVFADLGQPDLKAVQQYSSAAFRFAMGHKKIALPCGLFEGVVCFSVALVSVASRELIEGIRRKSGPKHWAAFEFPVIWDPARNQVVYCETRPIWGAAYYKGFCELVQRYLGAV